MLSANPHACCTSAVAAVCSTRTELLPTMRVHAACMPHTLAAAASRDAGTD